MKSLVLALAASTALMAVPAAAASYNFAFTGTLSAGGAVAAAGTFTTTGSTITGITGTYNGSTIDQLFAPGTVVDTLGDAIDNHFSATAPFLTGDGLGFGIAGDSPNLLYNLYATSSTTYALYISTFPATGAATGSTNNSILTFTVTPAAAVPEAASWAMMLMGLGMVGGVMRHRARVSRVTFA